MNASVRAIAVFVIFFTIALARQTCTLPATSNQHTFSICTMVQNEAKYIEEWVAYHILQNISHFYIYNDRSTDNIEEVLAPYISEGFVSLINWDNNITVPPSDIPVEPSYTRSQRFAIADCVWNHREESLYFGIWDVDEFLSFTDPITDMPSFIDGILVPQSLDSYHIPMQSFGPSGHVTTPQGLVIENYAWRGNMTIFGVDEDNKFFGKSLYRSGCSIPEVHFSPHLPHGCKPHYEFSYEEGYNISTPILLRHYFSKSWTDFKAKYAKWGWIAKEEEFKEIERKYSFTEDTSMLEWVEPVLDLMDCMASRL